LDGRCRYEEETRGIRLSLNKKIGTLKKRRHTANFSEDSDSENPGDFASHFFSTKKRRRMTFDNQHMKKLYSSKPSKVFYYINNNLT
jgi:hypothetical protein